MTKTTNSATRQSADYAEDDRHEIDTGRCIREAGRSILGNWGYASIQSEVC